MPALSTWWDMYASVCAEPSEQRSASITSEPPRRCGAGNDDLALNIPGALEHRHFGTALVDAVGPRC